MTETSAPTVHRICRVQEAGKYCEIWLDPPSRPEVTNRDISCGVAGPTRRRWDIAPKWDYLRGAVERGGLDERVLNRGYEGLSLVVHGDNIVALFEVPSVAGARCCAAGDALDEICKLVDAPDWEYPGQVVRDVKQKLEQLRQGETKSTGDPS